MSEVHIGRNIRAIRVLQDMKQETFARKRGIAQQNISKLEASRKVSSRKLQAVAEALGVTVDAIQTFSERDVLRATTNQPTSQVMPAKEIIDFFRDEIAKRDHLIDQLRAELDKFKAVSKSAN